MTREEAIKILSNHEMIDVMWDKADEALNMAIDALEQEPCDQIKWERDTAIAQLKELGYGLGEKPKTGWIPLKTRPMTEEETEHYFEYMDMRIDDTYTILDCPLPDDGQDVLVSWGGNVCIDTFFKDYDGCYFEGVDIDDVDAWQPLPEPYKTESKEENNG